MSTSFGCFEEFWAAMARLYDQTLKHEELIAENAAGIARLREAQEATDRQMQATDTRLDRPSLHDCDPLGVSRKASPGNRAA